MVRTVAYAVFILYDTAIVFSLSRRAREVDAGLMKKIGLIGVGNMGYYMGLNLLKKNFSLTVFDIRKEPMAKMKKRGAATAYSPKEVAEKCEVILTSLPSSSNVKGVVFGKNGLIDGIERGKTLIEMSTIDPYTMIEIGKAVESRKANVLDAPVSGVPSVAKRAELVIMIGGRRRLFVKHSNIFAALGRKMIYVGELGNGKIAKLANNTLTSLNSIAVCEVANWVIHSGLSLRTFYSIITETSAYSRRVDQIIPKILRSESPKGSIFNLKKDLTLALETASQEKVSMPMTSLATQFLQSAISLHLTSAGIVKIFEILSGRSGKMT